MMLRFVRQSLDDHVEVFADSLHGMQEQTKGLSPDLSVWLRGRYSPRSTDSD